MMTFMFAAFSSGLVIYYTWNNMLSMAQQYLMMKREGVPVHLFENLRPPAFRRPNRTVCTRRHSPDN